MKRDHLRRIARRYVNRVVEHGIRRLIVSLQSNESLAMLIWGNLYASRFC